MLTLYQPYKALPPETPSRAIFALRRPRYSSLTPCPPGGPFRHSVRCSNLSPQHAKWARSLDSRKCSLGWLGDGEADSVGPSADVFGPLTHPAPRVKVGWRDWRRRRSRRTSDIPDYVIRSAATNGGRAPRVECGHLTPWHAGSHVARMRPVSGPRSPEARRKTYSVEFHRGALASVGWKMASIGEWSLSFCSRGACR